MPVKQGLLHARQARNMNRKTSKVAANSVTSFYSTRSDRSNDVDTIRTDITKNSSTV